MSFIRCDHDEKYLTLHDCVAERAYFEDGMDYDVDILVYKRSTDGAITGRAW